MHDDPQPKAGFEIDLLRAGYVHELTVTGLRSAQDEPLAPEVAHSTLNQIPTTP